MEGKETLSWRVFPKWLRWSLRIIVWTHIGIVIWDALALMEAYGLRRSQADCAAYLAATNSLLRGDLLRVPSLYELLPYGWISEWPLGYPAVIALATKLTGLEPFYASRWLNVFLYLLTYGFMVYFFRSYAEVLFLFIYPPNYTWNVTLALSENLFIPLFVLMVAAIQRYYESRRRRWLWVIGILMPVLFLTRYAAIALGAGLGVWGLWRLYQRERKEGLIWIGMAMFQAVFAAGYFLWNAYHHPAGESGLRMRFMPMPPDFFWRMWEDMTYLRYAVLMGMAVVVAWRWWGSPVFTPAEKKRNILLHLFALTQAILYGWGMAKGRVGIVDVRHFIIILQPVMWYWGDRMARTLPPWLLLMMMSVFLGWQIRNTHRHYRWTKELELLPYDYVERVKQVYDTLPPRSCIMGASLAYPIKGNRTDLSLGDMEAYLPILLRDCECFYVHCGALEARYRLGLVSGIMWPFVKFCRKPCSDDICLQKVGCVSSVRKSSGASQ